MWKLRNPLAMRPHHLLAPVLLALAGGCASSPDPTTLPMHDGATAQRLDWDELVARSLAADVVVLGEEHDDATAHALQAALVADVLALDPRTAVSLEMLERPEQPLVDDWLGGRLDTATFVAETGSDSWPDWDRYYQPVLDAARSSGGRVFAANAPRPYVRRARIEGYDALRVLPETEQAWFDLPETLDQGRYWLRFRDTMRGFRGDDASDEEIRRTFASQLVWDATMAATVARALQEEGVDRVIHLVGRFHGDFEGGTIREIRRLAPEAAILSISCVGEGDGASLAEDDRARADVVVYTGKSGNPD